MSTFITLFCLALTIAIVGSVVSFAIEAEKAKADEEAHRAWIVAVRKNR